MARLFAKTGNDAGRVFRLTRNVTKVGRHTDNDVVLDDALVSRFHAQVLEQADGCFIRDVGSTAGTFVNGTRITEDLALNDHDLICLGDTELVFQAEKAKKAGAQAPLAGTARTLPTLADDDQSALLDERTIAFSVPNDPSTATEQLSGRRAVMLSRVADAIKSVSDLDELLGALLDVIFDVFHPDRGVILLREEPDGELITKVTRPEHGEFVISRTIVDYAVRHQVSLMVPNTAGDARFSGAVSIQDQSIRAAICSPLICKDRVLGALYVDAQVDLLAFRREDLALLNIIAANAAIAIENAILIREKFEAVRLAEDEPGPIVAQSASMRGVQERIAELAQTWAPVLVRGDSGTGKFFAAKTVHKSAGGHEAPFIDVDCFSIVGEEASKTLFGSLQPGDFAETASGSNRASLSAGGALRLADRGTLVLRHVGTLDLASQEILSRYLEARSNGDKVSPQVCVIATTSEDLEALVEAGRFSPLLAEQLSANTLEMPRLIDRKEDILPLSRLFVAKFDQRTHECEHVINKSAEHTLLRLQYRQHNVTELREAVEFAALVAEGPEIGAEHIFTGPKDRGPRIEFDLGESAPVQWLSHPLVFNILQTMVLLFFLGIAVVCLAASGTLAGRIANGLVWGLWWPALMVLFLFAGRVWCPVCPIAKVGRIAQKVWSFNRRPPQWIKKQSGWIMAILFFAIIWNEHVFQMLQKPVATAFLLLTLMACSVVLCVLHAREVWCRYVCPLGGLAAGYSASAPLHVHATAGVCAAECRTHECFKGSESESGCPMFHHPLYLRDAHFCKLCLACIRTCPNRSAKIVLHPPLQDLWRLREYSTTLIPFSLVAFFLTIVMLASHREQLGLADSGSFTVAACLALGLAFALNIGLPRLLSRDRDPVVTSRVTFAMLLLAWGPLMAFHLENIPGLDSLRLGSTWVPPAGSFWAGRVPALEVSLLTVFQFAAVFFAALLAAITLWRIRVHAAKQGTEIVPWGWRIILVTCAAYLVAAVFLVSLGVISQ